MRILTTTCILAALSVPAWADRPVTEAERARLTEAVAAAGCSGGKMEFDHPHFEVDDATCADGKRYDLKFDGNFKLVSKKLED